MSNLANPERPSNDDTPFPEYCRKYEEETETVKKLSTADIEVGFDVRRAELIRRRGHA